MLTLKAADRMDKVGNKHAKDLIAAIKVVVPVMTQRIADRAIQIHCGAGMSNDFPIADIMATNRYLRIADGPEEVHASKLGKLKIGQYTLKV